MREFWQNVDVLSYASHLTEVSLNLLKLQLLYDKEKKQNLLHEYYVLNLTVRQHRGYLLSLYTSLFNPSFD